MNGTIYHVRVDNKLFEKFWVTTEIKQDETLFHHCYLILCWKKFIMMLLLVIDVIR